MGKKKLNGNQPVTQADLAIQSGHFTIRIDKLEERMDVGFAEVNGRLDKLEKRMDNVEVQLGRILQILETLDVRTRHMPTMGDFEKLSDRVFALETKG